MNNSDFDVLNGILECPGASQRELAAHSGVSLGGVNRSLKTLKKEGYLSPEGAVTEKTRAMLPGATPRQAVILAAGFGLRMIPINLETPKGVLQVKGEVLIERLIRQLHQVGVHRITVVVGFMKEQYEYLIQEFGVELVVNTEYASRNNLYSLRLALSCLENAYLLPCDLWCAENPFRRHEFYSWYLMSGAQDPESRIRVTRKRELVDAPEGEGSRMIGIAYLTAADGRRLRERVEELCAGGRHSSAFWELALAQKGGLWIPARVAPEEQVVEINTYEQLRELDGQSKQLQSKAIDVIAKTLEARPEEITDIATLKKGMSNRSFLFCCRGRKYIMRIPGEGSDQLINRREEAAVYQVIRNLGICDDIAYINPENGYKITVFLEGARNCDPLNREDVARCMERLRAFHGMGLAVPHRFDIFEKIQFYESLREGKPSAYRDYERTKAAVFALKPYIDAHAGREVLCHIDSVPDNFLFCPDGRGGEALRLIDWEYAGMQDPHVDIAMFGIYALYNRAQMDELIDLYFPEGCPREVRIKIYCYVAACGLLWSNWCEFKHHKGVEFGAYSLRQYGYAKEFGRLAAAELEEAYVSC